MLTLLGRIGRHRQYATPGEGETHTVLHVRGDRAVEGSQQILRECLVLGLEDPRSIVAFGLRTTILEGAPREIPEVLAGLDSVTRDDVARVAKDLLAPDKLRLAAIGPFDDEKRFEALLA